MNKKPDTHATSDMKYSKMSVDNTAVVKRLRKMEKKTWRHAHLFVFEKFSKLREVRLYIGLWMVIVVSVLAASYLQLSLTASHISTTTQAQGGAYAEGVVGVVETVNPLYATTAPELSASKLLFSTLYTYDAKNGMRADLAESTTVDESGTIYTVKIRPNVQWHDGEPLTARDVAFTVELMKNKDVRSPYRTNWTSIDVEVLDDQTLSFSLPAKYASFQHALTFSVVPKHLLESIEPSLIRESTFSYAPVGSGPFAFKNIQLSEKEGEGKIVNMTAYDDYYGGRPYLNRFELRAYDTMNALEAAFIAGKLNGAADVMFEDATFESESKKAIKSTINNGVYALFNTDNQVLKDDKVRKALQKGIDIERLRSAVGKDTTPLDLPYIAGQVPKSPQREAIDRTGALVLLDEAGWKLTKDEKIRKNKDNNKLELAVSVVKGGAIERAANNLATQLGEMGVAVSVNVIDTSAPGVNFISDTLQGRNFDILVYELVIGGDPDVFAYWHSSQNTLAGYNFTGYSSSLADAALMSARDRLEYDLRSAKYAAFAKQWLKDAPAIGLYQAKMVYAVAGDASIFAEGGSYVSPSDRYDNVVNWSVVERSVYKTP